MRRPKQAIKAERQEKRVVSQLKSTKKTRKVWKILEEDHTDLVKPQNERC